jgi:hypothetical protein
MGYTRVECIERHLDIRGEDGHEQRGGRVRAEPPRARGGEQGRTDDLADATHRDNRRSLRATRRGDDTAVGSGHEEMEDAGAADQRAESEQGEPRAAAHPLRR